MSDTASRQPAARSTSENDLLALMLGVAGTQLIGLAAERSFGYSAEEMIGKSILCLAVPGHGDEMLEILTRSMHEESTSLQR